MNKNLIKNKFKWLWFFLSLSLLINQPIAAANDSAQAKGGIDTRSFIKGEVFPGTTIRAYVCCIGKLRNSTSEEHIRPNESTVNVYINQKPGNTVSIFDLDAVTWSSFVCNDKPTCWESVKIFYTPIDKQSLKGLNIKYYCERDAINNFTNPNGAFIGIRVDGNNKVSIPQADEGTPVRCMPDADPPRK